jgi:hypothetical protein
MITIIKYNLKEVPDTFQEVDYNIKIPKLKEINIPNLTIDESIKPYLFYHSQKNDRTDYFYLIGHPLVLEKLKKRRYQGTKDKNMNTIEKYNLLLKTIEELNNI